MTIPSSAPPKPPHNTEPRAQNRAPTDPPTDSRLSQTSREVSREAFERALAQGRRLRAEDEASPSATAADRPPAVPEPAMWPRAEQPLPMDPGPPIFASSQPTVQAPGDGAAFSAPATTGATADAAAAGTLRAALSGLQVPASADGLQHWQFSFSHQGAPLSGVSLTARPDAPWQLQLQLPAHARERPALDARLGELRQRLSGRGAQIGDIELHDSHDLRDPGDPRNLHDPAEPR